MSYRESMEKFVNEARNLIETKRYDVLLVFMANYGPQLVDRGADLDRLHEENERLQKVVDLIELKQERDKLRDAVEDVGKLIALSKEDTGDDCRATLRKIEKIFRARSHRPGISVSVPAHPAGNTKADIWRRS